MIKHNVIVLCAEDCNSCELLFQDSCNSYCSENRRITLYRETLILGGAKIPAATFTEHFTEEEADA